MWNTFDKPKRNFPLNKGFGLKTSKAPAFGATNAAVTDVVLSVMVVVMFRVAEVFIVAVVLVLMVVRTAMIIKNNLQIFLMNFKRFAMMHEFAQHYL